MVPEVGHAGFGALIAGERRLYKGLALHLERGPVARLSLQALVKNGAEAGSTAGERFIALSHPLIFSVESGDGCSTELGGRVI